MAWMGGPYHVVQYASQFHRQLSVSIFQLSTHLLSSLQSVGLPHIRMAMTKLYNFLLVCLVLASNNVIYFARGQNEGYDDFGQDNLYHDYAMRQQEKEAAAAA